MEGGARWGQRPVRGLLAEIEARGDGGLNQGALQKDVVTRASAGGPGHVGVRAKEGSARTPGFQPEHREGRSNH